MIIPFFSGIPHVIGFKVNHSYVCASLIKNEKKKEKLWRKDNVKKNLKCIILLTLTTQLLQQFA